MIGDLEAQRVARVTLSCLRKGEKDYILVMIARKEVHVDEKVRYRAWSSLT